MGKKNTIIIDHQTQIDDDISNLEGHIKHYGWGVYRKRNPNHQFILYDLMRNDDKILFDKKIDNLWYVVRTIHDRTNHKCLEFRTLYWCEECKEWCNKGKLYKYPIKLGKSIIKKIHNKI